MTTHEDGPRAKRLNLNLWDSFSPILLADGPVELFGARNIGHMHLTDMQVPNLLPFDTSAQITSWYARTNVIEMTERVAKAWHAWKHMTTVTLLVGDWPVLYRPLADILGPDAQRPRDTELVTNREETAMLMSVAFARRVMESAGAGHAAARVTPAAYWRALEEHQRQGWLDAVDVMRPVADPVAIPSRQTFRVTVNTHARTLSALLEAMPGDMAAQVLVWVHLDGLQFVEVS